MLTTVQLSECVHVVLSDCLDALREMPDSSVDSIVTDPPAGISFMLRSWDSDKGGRDAWVEWMGQVAAECLRVIKPGGHAFVWAIPKTSHWTGWAWEGAGWQCREKVYHCFGSGFPKSANISAHIDKAAGAVREVVGRSLIHSRGNVSAYPKMVGHKTVEESGRVSSQNNPVITAPATEDARKWDGWGTALKPSIEEWWLFRKPLEKGLTVAANVLKHGTGGLNIEACRVGTSKRVPGGLPSESNKHGVNTAYGTYPPRECKDGQDPNIGRWPSQLIHDGSDEVVGLFPETTTGKLEPFHAPERKKSGAIFGKYKGLKNQSQPFGGDSGSASRYFQCCWFEEEDIEATRLFYCAKATQVDRNEGCEHNNHPTVKSTELMRYLCRLITPPGGLVLDPFLGSGSTGKAAVLEGFGFIGFEKEPEYIEIAIARIKHAIKRAEEEKAKPKQLDLL